MSLKTLFMELGLRAQGYRPTEWTKENLMGGGLLKRHFPTRGADWEFTRQTPSGEEVERAAILTVPKNDQRIIYGAPLNPIEMYLESRGWPPDASP